MVVSLDKAMTEMLGAGWLWKTGQDVNKELMSLFHYNDNCIFFSVYIFLLKMVCLTNNSDQDLNANGELKEI